MRRGAWFVATVLVGALVGWGIAWWGSPRVPGQSSAEAGFARDMQTHHAQAVELSILVRDRTEDAALQTLALDIMTGQQHQIGQMAGWLAAWGLDQTGTAEPMGWMRFTPHGSHADPDAPGVMPGMATPQQVAQLAAANGAEAERLFLRLMIEHHRGGVAMAEAILHTDQPEVRVLARAVVGAQAAEIAVMEGLLSQRATSP